jgi:hypothetical protein
MMFSLPHMRLPGICLVLFCGALLMPLRPAVASDQVENIGDTLRVLIPAIAYGSTFYLHDSDGRKQFYKAFFTKPYKGFAVTPLADGGFYGIAISKQW